MDEVQSLQYESAAIGMALIALIKTHPDPGAFAQQLRLIAGDLQVDGAAAGSAMPDPTRTLLHLLLSEADAETAFRAAKP